MFVHRIVIGRFKLVVRISHIKKTHKKGLTQNEDDRTRI